MLYSPKMVYSPSDTTRAVIKFRDCQLLKEKRSVQEMTLILQYFEDPLVDVFHILISCRMVKANFLE